MLTSAADDRPPGGRQHALAPLAGPRLSAVTLDSASRQAHDLLPHAMQVKTCSPGWIFTSSHLLPPKAESSKAVTLKSASLGALHAVDNSCSPGAPAHLHRLLKQQAPHCPQLW